MQVFKEIDVLKQFQNSVITVGTFDGVHKGHQQIIKKIVSAAKEIEGESVIITFYPHPRMIIQPENPVFHLNTLSEKLHLLETHGVDNVVVVPFSREFSEMHAEDYVENFLIKKFQPKVIVFGYDHKFGNNREGDINLLKAIANNYSIKVEEISAKTIHDLAVSSTRIRTYLSEGAINEANDLLGYPFELQGVVVKGDQIGRTLGFPTANLHLQDIYKLIPADGVYVTEVKIGHESKTYHGLLSIGNRPTFNKSEKRIEVNILQFDNTIYGEEITLSLLHFIRKDKKFNSSEELVSAMHLDKTAAENFLRTNHHAC